MNDLFQRTYLYWLLLVLWLPLSSYGQHQLTIESASIPAVDTVWVFTPSDYAKTQKSYPGVYLLHGYSGTYQQWNDVINLQSFADRFEFVIITPDGFYDSWYLNSPLVENSQYEDFFFRGLMPKINREYRINRNELFISGLSIGGHGALHLFSQRPDLFKSAGSTSGVVDLTGAAGKYGLPNLLGPLKNNIQRWKDYSVVGNLDAIAAAKKKIILSCGWDDPFFKMNKQLIQKADSLAIDATFVSHPGGHDYDYWNKSLPIHLFFFQQQLDK